MAGTKSDNIEYWHNEGKWLTSKPKVSDIRVPGVVHECSTLYMGEKSDEHAALNSDYSPYGCRNVYVTGGAIFPSAGKSPGLSYIHRRMLSVVTGLR